MKCERCGRNVPIRSKVCPNCGKDNPNYVPRRENIYEQPVTRQTRTPPPAQPTAGGTQTSAPVTPESKPAPKKSNLKTLLIVAAIAIVVIIIITQSGPLRLKGTWEASDGSAITFSDSKNGYISVGRNSLNFTYFVEGDELELKTKDSIYSYSQVIRYEFKISGSTLTLTDLDDGMVEVFHKK